MEYPGLTLIVRAYHKPDRLNLTLKCIEVYMTLYAMTNNQHTNNLP